MDCPDGFLPQKTHLSWSRLFRFDMVQMHNSIPPFTFLETKLALEKEIVISIWTVIWLPKSTRAPLSTTSNVLLVAFVFGIGIRACRICTLSHTIHVLLYTGVWDTSHTLHTYTKLNRFAVEFTLQTKATLSSRIDVSMASIIHHTSLVGI